MSDTGLKGGFIITRHFSGKPMPIKTALTAIASQEGCDGEEYDVMMQAAEYIGSLEEALLHLQDKLHESNERFERIHDIAEDAIRTATYWKSISCEARRTVFKPSTW